MTPALQTLLGSIAAGLRPDARITISEWAEAQRILPPDTPEPGPWRNSRTPYLVDIMDTMSPSSQFREGWLKKGVQLGGSALGENFLGASICNAAGSILVVFPTLEDARQWELTRFDPMRKATPALRRRVRDSDVKGADNTKLRKKFPGGVMRLVSANRVGALKSATIRYVKFEEPDEYVMDLGQQGNPIGLGKNRALNFGAKARIFGDGTPTLEGSSAIDAEYQRGDQRKRFMRCPHCQHPQFFRWEQMRWDDGQPETARYACTECGALSNESAWKSGVNMMRPMGWTEAQCKAAGYAYWEATAQGVPGVASWHLPSLYAPLGWRPWPDMVARWLAAQGDPVKIKEFVNNELGEVYADKVSVAVNASTLQGRAEAYGLMTAPQQALVVVAGVDTQDNRLAIVIRAYGRGEESWGVFHGEIYGDPSTPAPWRKLADLLDTPIQHASGQRLRVDAVAVDSGGHHTEDVYAFCRDAALRGRHWFAIKGASQADAPKLGRPKTMSFDWRGQAVPGGATLRFVGTQAIKNVLDGRLRLGAPGPGFVHFPRDYSTDYFTQLRAEKREWRRDKTGKKVLWWVNSGGRNEAWDCEVYAYAALLYVLSGQHADSFFRTREKILAPVLQHDLFDPAARPAPAELPPSPEGHAGHAEATERDPVPDPDPDDSDDDAGEDTVAAHMAALMLERQRRRDSASIPLPRRRGGGFVSNWR